MPNWPQLIQQKTNIKGTIEKIIPFPEQENKVIIINKVLAYAVRLLKYNPQGDKLEIQRFAKGKLGYPTLESALRKAQRILESEKNKTELESEEETNDLEIEKQEASILELEERSEKLDLIIQEKVELETQLEEEKVKNKTITHKFEQLEQLLIKNNQEVKEQISKLQTSLTRTQKDYQNSLTDYQEQVKQLENKLLIQELTEKQHKLNHLSRKFFHNSQEEELIRQEISELKQQLSSGNTNILLYKKLTSAFGWFLNYYVIVV